MTVSTQNTWPVVFGDGVQTDFTITFEALEDAALEVMLINIATGVETIQTNPTHYSVVDVSGVETIRFVTAPPATEKIAFRSITPATQPEAISDFIDFPAERSEVAHDRRAFIEQELREHQNRGVRVPADETGLVLPGLAARKGKTATFNSETGEFEPGPSTTELAAQVQTATDKVSEASASADDASTSAGSASTSSASAASSATSASSSAGSASTSEVNASTSAGNAAASAASFSGAWVGLASAATLDLSAIVSANIDITGTVSISSFGTAVAGTFKRLRFGGALTIVHATNVLMLPGAENLAVSAGDVLEVVSEGGGFWRVVKLYLDGKTSFSRSLDKVTDASSARNQLELKALAVKDKIVTSDFENDVVDPDISFAANSDTRISTQKATLGKINAAIDSLPKDAVRRVATTSALRVMNDASFVDGDVIHLKSYSALGDGGGGIFDLDGADTTSGDDGIMTFVDALGNRWKRRWDGDVVLAVWAGFKADDSSDNSGAINAAQVHANGKVLEFPAGAGRTGNHSISAGITWRGAGKDRTYIKRIDNLNNRVIFASGVDDIVIEGMTIDGNPLNNLGSGAHAAIRFETCSNWTLRDVRCIGWKGIYAGSPVGSGFVAINGSGGVIDASCEFVDCYDGFTILGHPDGLDQGCTVSGNQRNGALIDDYLGTGSDRWVSVGVNGTGNSIDYAGAGYLIQDSVDCKTIAGHFANNAKGHGLQHNNADRCEVHGGTFHFNGISGVDFFSSVDGKTFGGCASNNTVRGLEVDTGSHNFQSYGFCGESNADTDISIFRSEGACLTGTKANVRVWDSATLASLSVAAGGTGYTDGTHAVTLVGGTFGGSQAQATATVVGGVVTSVGVVTVPGDYWTLPASPATVTGIPGGGSGATFNLVWVGENSKTCEGFHIDGSMDGKTLTIASGSADNVHLSYLLTTTIIDPGKHVATAVGCENVSVPKFDASLENDWVIENHAIFYKDSNGIVFFEGLIKTGIVAANTILFTLPVGFRPAQENRYLLTRSSGTANVYIGTDGTVRDLGGSLSNVWTSLTGIFFRAA